MWVQLGIYSTQPFDELASTTTKRKRDQVEYEKPIIPLDQLLKSVYNQDPKIEFYFPQHTTDDERNLIYRAAFFFAQQPPRSLSPATEAVMASLRQSIFTLSSNGSAQQPCSLKLSSAKQISNLLQFIENCGGQIWKSCYQSTPRMFIRIEESDYYAYEI